MLTDIFAHRYEHAQLPLNRWDHTQRLLVQMVRLLEEQVCPYWVDGKADETGKAFWSTLNKRLSMELGMSSLSPEYNGGSRVSEIDICKNWMLSNPKDHQGTISEFIKERLSLVELGFRLREERLNTPKPKTGLQDFIDINEGLKALQKQWSDAEKAGFRSTVDELNERLRRAGYPLHYHNGYLQFSEDELIEDNIEAPFWALVSDPKWGSVDHDMKEAVDRRDTGGRDPAFYAARALESAIKIVCDEKGWTTGSENGANNFIEKLGSKGNGRFIEVWEADQLKNFFSKVRNPFSHGPGSAPIPSLTPPQTDWAIAFCMAWVRSLIVRM